MLNIYAFLSIKSYHNLIYIIVIYTFAIKYVYVSMTYIEDETTDMNHDHNSSYFNIFFN